MQQEGKGREAGVGMERLRSWGRYDRFLATIIGASERRVPFRVVPQLAKESKL